MTHRMDRISLLDYEGKDSKESMYFGRSVAINAGDRLTVPIPIQTPRSLVEYAIEIPSYELGVAITAERGSVKVIVKTASRLEAKQGPLTHRFLVGTAPCIINFLFDNEFSWMRDQVVSYTVTVKPPISSGSESMKAGRLCRVKACIKVVDEDLNSSRKRLEAMKSRKEQLRLEVKRLEVQLKEKKDLLAIAKDETEELQKRSSHRSNQRSAVQKKIQDSGWDKEEDKHANEKNADGDMLEIFM